MKSSFATKNEIDLIRFLMRVDALILPWPQAIDIEKILIRLEDGDFLHLLVREPHEIDNVSGFHTNDIRFETALRRSGASDLLAIVEETNWWRGQFPERSKPDADGR